MLSTSINHSMDFQGITVSVKKQTSDVEKD
jgi:hypothetical protein